MGTLIFAFALVLLAVYACIGPKRLRRMQQQRAARRLQRRKCRRERRAAFVRRNYSRLAGGGHDPDDYERLNGCRR